METLWSNFLTPSVQFLSDPPTITTLLTSYVPIAVYALRKP